MAEPTPRKRSAKAKAKDKPQEGEAETPEPAKAKKAKASKRSGQDAAEKAGAAAAEKPAAAKSAAPKARAAAKSAAKPRAKTAKKTKAAAPAEAEAEAARLRAEIAERAAAARALAEEIAERERALAALGAAGAAAAEPKRSPFAPARFPELPEIAGVELAHAEAAVRYAGRPDVMLARVAPGAAWAGVFTRSKTAAAPVLWCRETLGRLEDGDDGRPTAVIVNAGNANAFTGDEGARGVRAIAAAVAAALGAPTQNVFVASTGVIGEPLPAERITDKIAEMRETLAPGGWYGAARAIMTTDTYPKGAWRAAEVEGARVKVAGIAKGSGMIAPDMATMLAFVFTDATVTQGLLQRMVSGLTGSSFNAVTVDGDTSTSDTLLVAATGAAGAPVVAGPRSAGYGALRAALSGVMKDLALQIVRDGEGVRKVVAVTVSGARSSRAAKAIARAIAESPLVKTAWAGEDPNWGRIVMAVGKSGEEADRDALSIRYGAHPVAEKGARARGYDEETLAAYMTGGELRLHVDVGVGYGEATVWGCDLGHDYVSINADYRS